MGTATKPRRLAANVRGASMQHHDGQGYAIDCGKWIGSKGTEQYKRHYLGHEKLEAEKLAAYIRGEWSLLKLRGVRLWTPDAMQRIAAMRAGVDPQAIEYAPPTLQTPPTTIEEIKRERAAEGLTLYGLMEQYENVVKSKVDSRQASDAHYDGTRSRFMAVKKLMPDVSLTSLGYDHLICFAQKLASRPVGARGERWSIVTCKNYRSAVVEVLTYAEDSGLWRPGFNWRRSLKLKTKNMKTSEEKREIVLTEVYEPDMLRQLWNATTAERDRLYMLMGLNFGATAKEIATLELAEVFLDGIPAEDVKKYQLKHVVAGAPYVMRNRHKTGVVGIWPVWPEVQTLMRRHLAPADTKSNPDGLAITGLMGMPLVRRAFTGNSRVDEVAERFLEVREIVKEQFDLDERPLPHKHFRKTGYEWIKQHERFNTDIAEAYSQHKEPGMVVNYSNPLFAKVADAVTTMREELILPVMFKNKANPIIHADLSSVIEKWRY